MLSDIIWRKLWWPQLLCKSQGFFCFAKRSVTDLHRSFDPLFLACFRWRNILETLSHIRLYTCSGKYGNVCFPYPSGNLPVLLEFWKSDAMAFDSTEIQQQISTHQSQAHVNDVLANAVYLQDSGDMYFGVQVWQLSSHSMFSPALPVECPTWKTKSELTRTMLEPSWHHRCKCIFDACNVATTAASVLSQCPCKMHSVTVLLCGQLHFGCASCQSTLTVAMCSCLIKNGLKFWK